MFLGTHTPKLDEKGRLILPAKFRDELADGVVITIFQERCLAIYTRTEFLRMTEPLRSASTSTKETRDYQRMLASAASEEQPDRQGRITVPLRLRQYAGLDKDCVVVGAIDRVEVWNPEAWAPYSREQEEAFAVLDRELPRP